MKNIFLTSSFADVFERTEENLTHGKTVTFIPTASMHEDVTFYVEDVKTHLKSSVLPLISFETCHIEYLCTYDETGESGIGYETGRNDFESLI